MKVSESVAEIEAHVITQRAQIDKLIMETVQLSAELARVKAESLRVVPWGCPVPISELHSRQAFQCDHTGVWRIYGCSHFNFDIRNISSYAETMLTEAAIVQPVRLERWEDE